MRKRGIVIAIAAFVFGVALFVHPRASLLVIGRLVGVLAVAAGIVTLVLAALDMRSGKAGKRSLILPIALIVSGSLIVWNMASLTAVLQVILGVLMIANGFSHLLTAGQSRRKSTSVLLILGGITILLGFTICIRPLSSMLWTTICGLFYIFDAIVGILTNSPDENPGEKI